MKKAIAFIILAVMAMSVFAGCGGAGQSTNNNIQPVATQANNQQVVTQPATQAPTTAVQNIIETAPPATQAATAVNNAVLTDLPFTDNANSKGWRYYDTYNEFTLAVDAYYCVDTDVVGTLAYITNCKKTKSDYAEHLSEDKAIQSALLAMNDPNITVILTEDEDGYMFASYFDNLDKADRAQRVAAAVEYIGVTADQTNTAFYCQALEAELKGYGFN